jgi:hypothetical protein
MSSVIPPSAERALAAALCDACPARGFTEAPVTSAAFDLGRAAAAARVTPDDVVARLDAIVRDALGDPVLGDAVTDAVLVFLWRYARQGFQSVRTSPHPGLREASCTAAPS